VIDFNAERVNAHDSIRFNSLSPSNEIDKSDRELERQLGPRISTCRGIVIDINAERAKAYDSIRFNSLSRSNEIDESDLQSERQWGPRIATCRGIVIDFNAERTKACDSIRFNSQMDSNETDNSDPAAGLSREARNSTVRGIRVEQTHNDENLKSLISFTISDSLVTPSKTSDRTKATRAWRKERGHCVASATFEFHVIQYQTTVPSARPGSRRL
jgi:hypothetical protein